MAEELASLLAAWRALPEGEALTLDWPRQSGQT
jgi:hypothetical protein